MVNARKLVNGTVIIEIDFPKELSFPTEMYKRKTNLRMSPFPPCPTTTHMNGSVAHEILVHSLTSKILNKCMI